ncbi:MAG TPA: gamma carbonic anhydrase family protein [Polyangiaceae bacterium]|nr:gamma carbonic anhydrase family protein [Polyangiaceae bacterium]
MPVYELNGVRPAVGRDVFIADGAVVVGDVILGDQASVWFGAVVRGDCFPIRIGARTNVQDGAIVHVTGGRARATVGDEVTIGHTAVLHGCTIGNRCLIGIGSIVLDDAVIGDDSLVAAGSLVTPGTLVPPRSVVMGRPARVTRVASEQDLERIREGAARYIGYALAFMTACKRVS